MGKKVLLISVSAGVGHVRAADALEAAFKERYPDLAVRNIDALKFTTKTFGRFYAASYLKMANYAPTLWGYVYERFDKEVASSDTNVPKIIGVIQNFNSTKLVRFVKKEVPDIILCTHFLPAEILSRYVRKKNLSIPLTVVITDFDMHSLWSMGGITRYFVATEAIAYKLQKVGYGPNQVSLSGIPIHPVFSRPINQKKVLDDLGLSPDIPRIMLLSGGFGMRQMQDTVTAIANVPTPLQILAVAGQNKKLKAKLDSMTLPDHIQLKTFPFISTIEELMEVSDFIITKPGGLSASESLAKSLPIIIFSPIPGQEERNSDYLLEAGAGVKVNSLVDLEFKLRYLIEHPDRARELRDAATRIARPAAAFTIADEIHNLIS